MAEIGWVDAYRNARRISYLNWLRLVEGRETLVRLLGAVAFALLTAAAAQIELHTPLSPVPFTLQVLPVLASGAFLGSRWGSASQGLYVGLGLLGAPVYAGGEAGLEHVFGLTGGYLVGFILASAVVGWLVHQRTLHANRALLLGAPLGLVVLAAIAAVDLWLLASRPSYLSTVWGFDYTTRDAALALVLLLGFGAVSAVLGAWAWGRRVQRDRLEAFLALTVGVLVIYTAGALGFLLAAHNDVAYAPLTFQKLVELAIVPFVPVDLFKAAIAAGLVTFLVPRRAERFALGG